MVNDGDGALDIDLVPTLVVARFYIFAVCVSFCNRGAAIPRKFERLTTTSAGRFYHTLRTLVLTDQTSSILEDIRKRYDKAFPHNINFTNFPSQHVMTMVDALIRRDSNPRPIWCHDNRPSDHEHLSFARDIAEVTQVEYRREQEVPEWIIDFAFDSLSLDPLPSVPIVTSCFEIVAIGLGYDVPDATTSDERYMCFSPTCIYLLTKI